MDTAATRTRKYSVEDPALYLAFELGNIEWKLGFSVGFGQRPRVRTIPARDLEGLQREIELAKKRFGLPESARVVSCYEAGRDGFSRRTHLPGTAHLPSRRTHLPRAQVLGRDDVAGGPAAPLRDAARCPGVLGRDDVAALLPGGGGG